MIEIRQAEKALEVIRDLSRDIREASNQLNRADRRHQAAGRVNPALRDRRGIGSVNASRALGLLASILVAGAAIVACRPSGNVGYVEIKTVPVAALTQVALYLDTTRLAPIKKGSAILRQPVGTVELAADGVAGALTPICEIVVRKNRITTVTVSVLEHPPRCQCRYTGTEAATAHECVS